MLKYLDQWAQGRFKPMAMLAQLVASSARDCHEVIVRSREPWLLATDEAGSITPSNWATYHRCPLQFEGEMLHFLCAPENPMGAQLAGEIWPETRREIFTDFREVVKQVVFEGISKEEIEDGYRWWDLYYRWIHMPTLESILKDEEELPPHYRQWFAEPGLVFFLSVATPCWLEYQRSPWQLLLEARQGHFVSLENLLRLDPEVRHDPAIRNLLFWMRIRQPERYDELMKAEREGRTTPITLAQVKFSLGGLLMKWSAEWEQALKGELWIEIMQRFVTPQNKAAIKKWVREVRKRGERIRPGCRLNAPAIKKLFDAVARDMGEGLVDPDFSQQPNSIYKRLTRNSELWPSLREMDISRAA